MLESAISLLESHKHGGGACLYGGIVFLTLRAALLSKKITFNTVSSGLVPSPAKYFVSYLIKGLFLTYIMLFPFSCMKKSSSAVMFKGSL